MLLLLYMKRQISERSGLSWLHSNGCWVHSPRNVHQEDRSQVLLSEPSPISSLNSITLSSLPSTLTLPLCSCQKLQGVGSRRVAAAHLALHTPKAELQARIAAGSCTSSYRPKRGPCCTVTGDHNSCTASLADPIQGDTSFRVGDKQQHKQ